MRPFSTLAFAGLVGSLFLVGDASACHKKKACACPPPAPVCAPAPVAYVAPAPVCAPAPVKKCHVKMPKIKMGHKKTAVCSTYAPAPYAAPATYAAPQAYPTGQATGQTM